MLEATCIDKVTKGDKQKYILQDKTGAKVTVSSEELKKALNNNLLSITNIKLIDDTIVINETEKRHEISHYDIFNYWKDKYIDAKGNIIEHYINGKYNELIEVVTDWDIPHCWCCGKNVSMKNNIHHDRLDTEALKHIWSNKEYKIGELNRCHIIPKSLGGSDTPQNLFLLCERCHKLSPDTVFPDIFFRYIFNNRHKYILGHDTTIIGTMFKELKDYYKLSNEIITLTIDKVGTEYIIKESYKSIGLHGGSAATSSISSALAKIIYNIYMKYKKDIDLNISKMRYSISDYDLENFNF